VQRNRPLVAPETQSPRFLKAGGDDSSLFARLINHQPTVLFSRNEPATSNQPQPASSTLLSEQTSTSHQPRANRTAARVESGGGERRWRPARHLVVCAPSREKRIRRRPAAASTRGWMGAKEVVRTASVWSCLLPVLVRHSGP
jgi:hypothetical protein